VERTAGTLADSGPGVTREIRELRNCNRSQDPENHDDNHQFDQREACLHDFSHIRPLVLKLFRHAPEA